MGQTRKLTEGIVIFSLLILIFSCKTVPERALGGYFLPRDGERNLYLSGVYAEEFLEPMAETLEIDDFSKIEPILERTEKIYLVTRGDSLYIQGEGDYNTGSINLVLATNRDWKKIRLGSFKAYESESTSLQLAFPDSRTFFMSQGDMVDLFDSYISGGSEVYPYNSVDEQREALLMDFSLEGDDILPMQSLLNTPLKSIQLALSPIEEERTLMDVTIKGNQDSGRFLGTALKLFLLASVGRDAMAANLETGNDYARITDFSVEFAFIMDMMGFNNKGITIPGGKN